MEKDILSFQRANLLLFFEMSKYIAVFYKNYCK